MATITVETRDGTALELPATPGHTVMEIMRDGGVDEILALCGGCCSCATCHVYVQDDADAFGPISEDENDLLETSSHRRSNSRLSCQLTFVDQQSGSRFVIPADD